MSFWGLELETSKEMVKKVSEFLKNKSEDEILITGAGNTFELKLVRTEL